MATRHISFLAVGNGNFCLVHIDGMNLVFDLRGTEDKTSWELLKPLLPERYGKRCLDVLCISHGDQDHCGGFGDLAEEILEGRLVIGSIWHPNYDRTKVDDDLPEDYLALHQEILRRQAVTEPKYGDLEVPLTAWDDEARAFEGLTLPADVALRVLSPYVKDEGDFDWDVNDISLVLRMSISGLSILWPGDSGSEIWQERIIPHTLSHDNMKDWAQAAVALASHHGSYTLFGKTREEVLNADPAPENYEALDYIGPEFLIVSAASRFPTQRDQSGDQPPHYAAWKWYHKWFTENRDIGEDDKHPECFKYTADGHLRLELGNDGWEWAEDWSPPDDGGGTKALGFAYHGGETQRGGGRYA
jgi:hypothetical protein